MEKSAECWILGSNGFAPTPLKNLHPLLFPPVLNKIFSHLSFWNHKKCREVCKTWDAELRPFFRLNCKVNLSKLVTSISECSTPASESDNDAESTTTMDTDSYNYNNEQNCHSQSRLIYGISSICTSYVLEEDPIILKILIQQRTLPLQVKYLELKNYVWDLPQILSILRELPSLEELRLPIQSIHTNSTSSSSSNSSTSSPSQGRRNAVKNRYISSRTTNNYRISSSPSSRILETFPKLKILIITLTIRDLQFYNHKNTTIEPLLKLLQSTPNLEEIYYPNIVQFTSPFDNPARLLLENIIYSPNPSSQNLNRLSTLKIDTFLSNRDLKILSAKGFPFKSLQLTLTPDICTKNLYEFLGCVEPTLKFLALTFRDGFRLSGKFPLLRGLERMTLILWNGYLDFVQDIPQLKTMIVVLMEVEEEMVEISKKDFCQFSIEELDIHSVKISKGPIVQKLIKLSPTGLKRLTLDYVTDEILRGIFISLPFIEEFVILFGGFSESGVTGVPETFCREDYTKEFYTGGLKRFPGICDLKSLRSLVLTGELSDFMIIVGIVHCRSLKRLEMINRNSTKVTDKSLMKIADGMDNLELLRLKNFTEITEDGLTYLATKLSGKEIHIG